MAKKAKKKGGNKSKSSSSNKSQVATATGDNAAAEDDFDAILQEEASKMKSSETPSPPPPQSSTETSGTTANVLDSAEPPAEGEGGGNGGADAAAEFLRQLEGSEGAGAATKVDKKKRKKKKKGTGAGAAAGGAGGEKVSARGKEVLARLERERLQREEIQLAEEAELKRIQDIEAKEEAERQRILDEKEKKRLKKKKKKEEEIRAGTYMTPKQKEQAKQAKARLAAMEAAGMVVGKGKEKGDRGGRNKGKGVRGGNKRAKEHVVVPVEEPKEEAVEEDKEEEEADEVQAPPPNDVETKASPVKVTPAQTTIEEAENVRDDWDADSGDDWDADSNGSDAMFGDLDSKLKVLHVDSDDEEDLVEKEKAAEKERLRKLGLARQERDLRKAKEEAEFQAQQQQMEVQERMKMQKREEGKKRRELQEKSNLEARDRSNLRCPIVVIMGHVDTGKTKLLDKIRKTNVQGGEAGGITQQIGATFFEKKTLEMQTKKLNLTEQFNITVPGMLVIDTPGHESFTNLRSRGSSLCDVAILVVDVMHGLEQQTIESLNMLKSRKTPFVVALNKIDRCYDWKSCPDTPIRDALEKQPEGTVLEFRDRATNAKVQLQENGINSNLYWEMGDDDWENSDFVPLVPTSAISGEGVQDVLLLLCQMAEKKLWRQLMWHANLQCSVLEVKQIDGLGMTVDVLVVNGFLKEGDRAVFCTLNGPVITEIRGLLTPPPSREMRVKADYIHHKEVKGALGVKLIGNGLEKVMAGTPVLVINEGDEEEDIKSEVMSDLTNLQDKLNVEKKGVMVQASTLGALEALLQFLREETKPPIPVSAIGIGGIHKRDVTKISIMNEKGVPEYATILAFDVPINTEAREHAEEMGVRIFTADIIYHLFDQFTRYMDNLLEKRREEAAAVAVFPSIIRILPQHVFNQKDPIILGVEVVEGILKIGTPLCVPSLGGLHIGKVTSIEANGNEQETAKKGASVAVKIVNETNPTITYGRQFDSTHALYSTLTRASIDALKLNFKDKLENDDWKLVVRLKKVYNII